MQKFVCLRKPLAIFFLTDSVFSAHIYIYPLKREKNEFHHSFETDQLISKEGAFTKQAQNCLYMFWAGYVRTIIPDFLWKLL